MDKKALLLIAVAGVAAFMLMPRRANAATTYRVPGTTTAGQRYMTAPTASGAAEAAQYAQIGNSISQIIGNVYRMTGGGSRPASTGANAAPAYVPDDSIAFNPPGNTDPAPIESSIFWTATDVPEYF